MAKLDARSVIIILASFGLVAGTLILVQKRNASADSAAASGAQSLALNPPSAPIEMLGSGPSPSPSPAPAPVPVVPMPAPSAPAHSAPSAASAAIPSAAKPASSAAVNSAALAAVKPASTPASAPASTVKNHAIPAETEPSAPKSAAKPVSAPASVPVKPASAPVKPVSAAKPAAPSGHFFLQAGAFKDSGNAQKLLDRIKAAGFNAQISTSGELHKVLAGPYPTADAAGAAKAKLKAAGFDTFPAKQ